MLAAVDPFEVTGLACIVVLVVVVLSVVEAEVLSVIAEAVFNISARAVVVLGVATLLTLFLLTWSSSYSCLTYSLAISPTAAMPFTAFSLAVASSLHVTVDKTATRMTMTTVAPVAAKCFQLKSISMRCLFRKAEDGIEILKSFKVTRR